LIRAGLSSRSDEVAIAATQAARKLLPPAGAQGDDIWDDLANLLGDAHVNQSVRATALETLVSLNDPRLAAALSTAARDVGLEGSPLLQVIEERLVLRNDRIKL
jgi:hypothetical protein